MAAKYTDDFFKEMYASELEHKYKLDSADSLLIAVLLALSGVGIYYSKVFHLCNNDLAGWAFVIFGVLFCVAFASATCFMLGSFWPIDKALIATPGDWADYVSGLERYYSYYHDDKETDRRVADDLARRLRVQYVEAGEINRDSNFRKAGYQTRARRAITAAVVVALVNAAPTYFVQRSTSDAHSAEVVAFHNAQRVDRTPPIVKDENYDRPEEAAATEARAAKAGASQSSDLQRWADSRGEAKALKDADRQ